MNIKQAYNTLSQKEFVDWSIENNYPYFIIIEGNNERGWGNSKKGTTQYKFNYKIK